MVSNRERPHLTVSLVNNYISMHYQKPIKILVPSEAHVDAALNKDNLPYSHKTLQINKIT